MTTSLNKDLRAKIVDNVVNATNIPELEKSIRQRTKQRGREYVIAGLPEDFLEKTKDLPKEWLGSTNSLYVRRENDPEYYLEGQLGDSFHNYGYIRFDDPVTEPLSGGGKNREVPLEDFFADLVEEARALYERKATLTAEIRGFLLSCKTVEQVLERMPELESHIPKASKPMPLVAASNLLSSLTQLGFDRTKQAA